MKKFFFIFIGLLLINSVIGQRTAIELTFTAVNNTTYVHMDSIKIMNRTQGGETILVFPDTVLSVLWVGIPEFKDLSGLKVYQNYPNPAGEQTTINLYIPEQGQVNLMVTDVLGRTILSRVMDLSSGLHTLLFTPGKEAGYFLTVIWKGYSQSIKILHYSLNLHQQGSLEYIGHTPTPVELKALNDSRDFIIYPRDEMLYIGYADTLQSGILDVPEVSQTYTFQFATNIPCLGTPTVEYDGEIYNTIQIFSQCWLKENLNAGTRISGTEEQQNNGIIEKYCYDNVESNCDAYGGLYQWNEMMQFSTQQGTQGICPPGWHLPTDEEWKMLEGAVDSQYGIGNQLWDNSGYSRGFDAGLNLKSTWYWGSGNGTDLFGFTGLPGGGRDSYGNFGTIGSIGAWWSSTVNFGIIASYRSLHSAYSGVGRSDYTIQYGVSVRCVRD
ncbi:MAG TPA: FISUMP domain-containing protein [Bacteroidales bacterium]|nr:FISUMP domain-containing protein [Bacteroidales bacterium]